VKKILTLLFALALVFSLAACTVNTGSGNTSGEPTGTPSTAANDNSGGNADTSTVAGFISQYGLTEADINPEGFTSSELQDGNTVIYSVSTQPTNDQRLAWMNQIITKAKSLSDDGKLYDINHFYGTGGAEFDTTNLSAMSMYQISFTHNGKAICFTINASGTLDAMYSLAVLTK